MAFSDIKTLADYARQNESHMAESDLSFDSGRSSMVYARGNILLGKARYVKSLKVGNIRKFLMDALF